MPKSKMLKTGEKIGKLKNCGYNLQTCVKKTGKCTKKKKEIVKIFQKQSQFSRVK